MKKYIKSKIFIGAFLLSYFLFFLITIFLLDIKRDGFGLGHSEHGFPFPYYYSHCFGGNYIWSGLVKNILFSFIFSGIVGFVSSYLWVNFFIPFLRQISSPEFRKKWHL